MNLLKKRCFPCEGGIPPLDATTISKYLKEVPGWNAVENKKLVGEFKLKNFEESMGFVDRAAKIAETESHHPDIHILYNLVRFELTTHAIRGLSENDFILAAKINSVHPNTKRGA